jgi:chitinase
MSRRLRALVVAVAVALLAVVQPLAPARSGAATSMWVSGFYVGWMTSQYPPSAIDFSSLTHIMVFSVLPRTDGTLDTTMFMGSTSGPAMAKDVAARAHAAGRKAILAVGGGGYGSNFVGATSSTNIDRFVANLVQVVTDWGYDGIDLDWEPLTTTDFPAFNSLVAKLRAAKPGMLITADVNWRSSNFPMTSQEQAFYAGLGNTLDQVNIMTYGMADAWSGWVSWHSSALTGHASNRPSSVAVSVDQYLAAGVPAAKLGMGIGFYGSCWTSPVTGPVQSPSGSRVATTLNYADIMKSYHSSGAYRYDTTAQAPYLSSSTGIGPSSCTFLSYEDEQSIAAKADYARQRGLGGTIIWQINGGYNSAAADPGALLRAVGSAFLGTTPRTETATGLATSPASSVARQAVTLTATVSSASGTPEGSVTFRDGTTTIATVALSGGQASTTTTALTVGSHALTASYSGNAEHAPSTSATTTFTVAKAATTTAVASSRNPSPLKRSVTFTATVAASAPGGGVPTGTVRFFDGTTQIGSATLSAGRATMSTSRLTRGTHTITAVYVGSTAYTTSTSSALSQVVT